MGRRIAKLDLRRIRVSQSYTVPEVARLLKRTAPTIRAWIKQGLLTLTDTSPCLICGGDLKTWLVFRAQSRKQPCGTAKLLCCKCGCARRPRPDSVTTSAHTSKTAVVSGKCSHCGGHMRQLRSLSKLTEIISAMTVPAQGQLDLTGYIKPYASSLFEPQSDDDASERPKQDKFNVH